MKVCKIILIVLLVIKSIRELITCLNHLGDIDHPMESIISSLVVITIIWCLYYGAGVLDV